MAKTLTLEEAAEQLGLSVDQFKLNLKTHKDFKSVRPLMGGSSMHFREQDIAELGRKLGIGSAPELQLGEAGGDDDDQVEIGREPTRGTGASGSRIQAGQSSKHLPKPDAGDSSDEFIPLVDDPKSGKSGKRDSDVKVQKSTGDSAARIENRGKARVPSGTPTEEIDLAAEAKRAGKSDVFSLADDGGSGKKPGGKSSGKLKSSAKKDDGSEFELQLGADSDSEFELTLADDSDEVPLGSNPRDATGKAGKSGVRLNKPADSGISLEKEEDSDFELNLDSSRSKKITGPKSDKSKKKADSDSEFELSLDDSSGEVASLNLDASGEGEKDIFATDFDIPALDDSASEAVALEGDTDLESSDFDLDDSGVVDGEDSGSEVVQLDDDLVEVDEDEDRPRSSKKRRRDDDDDLDEALAEVEEDEDEEPMPAMAGPPQPARWGPLPALVLFPCLFVMLIITFMGFELMHSMWAYRSGGTKPTYTVTRGIAGLFKDANDMPKD